MVLWRYLRGFNGRAAKLAQKAAIIPEFSGLLERIFREVAEALQGRDAQKVGEALKKLYYYHVRVIGFRVI